VKKYLRFIWSYVKKKEKNLLFFFRFSLHYKSKVRVLVCAWEITIYTRDDMNKLYIMFNTIFEHKLFEEVGSKERIRKLFYQN
jgi:hypothetical protein